MTSGGGFSIVFDASVVNNWVDVLEQDVQSALRPAAQAGAQMLYEAVKLNVPVGRRGHWFHGTSFRLNGRKYWFDAGTLHRSIYQAFSRDNSDGHRATYHVSWNHKKAPYGFMVEYGTVKAPPVGFVRRAGLLMPQALNKVEGVFFKNLKHFK